MKNIFFIISGLIFLPYMVYATNLNVVIKDIDSSVGTIYVTICDSASFNIKNDVTNCLAVVSQEINGAKEYVMMFDNVPQGEWAIFGYVDENNNNMLDFNHMGIPKESVLFVKKLKGFPEFDYIKSTISGEKQTIILSAQ